MAKLAIGSLGCILFAGLSCGSPSGAALFDRSSSPVPAVAGSSFSIGQAGRAAFTSGGALGDNAGTSNGGSGSESESPALTAGGALGNAGNGGRVGLDALGGAGSDTTGSAAGATGSAVGSAANAAGAGGRGASAGGCVTRAGVASALSIYGNDDAGGACSFNLAPPSTGTWFRTDDGTGRSPPSFSAETRNDGSNAHGCYVHSSQSGARDWGGGFGFALNGSGDAPCPYDATVYGGLVVLLKGSTRATQGRDYQPRENTVRVNVVTTETSDVFGSCAPADGKCNDHYGVWCSLTNDWARCEVPFDQLSQRGWGAVKKFIKADLLEIQIVAVRDPKASAKTSWDLAAANVAFYP